MPHQRRRDAGGAPLTFDGLPDVRALCSAMGAERCGGAADMTVASDTAIPQIAALTKYLPFMDMALQFTWASIGLEERIIDVMAVAAFENLVAVGHGRVGALKRRCQWIARSAHRADWHFGG